MPTASFKCNDSFFLSRIVLYKCVMLCCVIIFLIHPLNSQFVPPQDTNLHVLNQQGVNISQLN